MKTTGNTILITGGGSGIGLETARQFAARGNRVIIAGRNKDKLEKAAGEIPGLLTIAADITDPISVEQLVRRIRVEYPELNMLMNNAGSAGFHSLRSTEGGFERALAEMQSNFLSAVRLTEQLMPLLLQKDEAAVINNSSVVSFVPAFRLPFYSAAKAALHSYTRSFRLAMSNSSLKVFELMPPLVDTEFARDIPGEKMSAAAVADALMTGLMNDAYEIYPGAAGYMYTLFQSSPAEAFQRMNRLDQLEERMEGMVNGE